jgi:hypothetical protein
MVFVDPGARRTCGHPNEFYRQVVEGHLAAREEDREHTNSVLAQRLYRGESQTRRAAAES